MEPSPERWTQRYREALSADEIRRRAEVKAIPVECLDSMPIETACIRLEAGLKGAFVASAGVCEIIRFLCERALAYAETTYAEPKRILHWAYRGVDNSDPYMPIVLTGLAGVGKTELRVALRRVLSSRTEVVIDSSHAKMPLIDYAEALVYGQRSVGQILKLLLEKPSAGRKEKLLEADLPKEITRWMRLRKTYLFSVDELQFLAQSSTTSTLVTRTLLAFAEVGIPWFAVCNYSLIWKLLRRPAEAKQRLLSSPVILFPDSPDSPDWLRLLEEYEIVCASSFAMKLSEYRMELWNLCAGLKRELVKLLINAYRLARHRNAASATWRDVCNAYLTPAYEASRKDIEALIVSQGQGHYLAPDLRCPFVNEEASAAAADYAQNLRKARSGRVAKEVVKASMTATERSAIDSIEKTAVAHQAAAANVSELSKRPRQRPTLTSLQDAGWKRRLRLGKTRLPRDVN